MKYGKVETEKLYFSSSEAAECVGVSVEVLHSWEREFADLNPKKNKNGKRVYRKTDIEIAKKIKENAAPTNSEPKAKTGKFTAKKREPVNKDVLMKVKKNLQKILDKIKTSRAD